MSFGRLVVLTKRQCNIYQIPNIGTAPVTLDISKDHISIISVCNEIFALMCKDRIIVHSSANGDIKASLSYEQGISKEKLSSETITFSRDTMAMIDNHETKVGKMNSLSFSINFFNLYDISDYKTIRFQLQGDQINRTNFIG